jgi:2,4-dienoyl-CoA reductase-like NADH-dependent reductase (Old Yellow Enzyme family)/thioredoxin reductase
MFDKLFEPARVGKMELRNRIVMPPMVTNFADPDSSVSEITKAYYAERAKGGVGLIIVEAAAICKGGGGSPLQLIMYKDEYIPKWRSLVDVVHRYGAKIGVEICHVGRQGKSAYTGEQPVGPSAIRLEREGWEVPRELSIAEIGGLVEQFAEAARRTKEAGFDAVEIHATHGYLLSTFISPHINKRTDKYGGDITGRARFTLEIIERTKVKCGSDYPVLVRINGADFVPGGLTLDESCVLSRLLQDAGADCIDVSAGSYGAINYDIAPASMPPGFTVYLAEAIKKVVRVPVIAVGRINTPALAESILQEGKADLVAIGRGLTTDPEFPKKAREGRIDEIRMCTACRECLDKIFEKKKTVCSVNAAYGNEAEYAITPAQKPKRVLIAGGGPGGLEAARVAALRGHKVVLYEEGNELGGQLRFASVPPYKETIGDLRKFLTGQMAKLGVEVKLGKKVTPQLIKRVKPDAVVVATGATPIVPSIEGKDRPNVFTFKQVLMKEKACGESVVIIGGGRVGCETADFLADQGKKVTILEMLDQIGADMGQFSKEDLFPRLSKMGVRMEANTKAEKITSKGVLANVNGKMNQFEADTVILATGSSPNSELAEQLKGKVAELHVIGDCVEPRRIQNAIHEGYRTGLDI